MKVAVFGSKEYKDIDRVAVELDDFEKGSKTVVILHGANAPPCMRAEEWGKEHGQECITFLPAFKVDYSINFDVKFLFARDRQIIHNADAVLFFWNEEDTSLKWAMRYANRAGKEVIVVKG